MLYSRDSGKRGFLFALLLSIALHAALLLARGPSLTDSLIEPVEALAPIVARLVEPAAPPPVPKPPPEERRAAAPPPSKPELARPERAEPEPPKPKPVPKPQAKPAPIVPPKPQTRPEAITPRAESATPSVIEPPAPTLAPAPAPAPSPDPLARAAPSTSPPATPAPDIDSVIAQYRAAVLAAARKYKRYPPMARDNGWEGEVVVRMSIGPDGSIVSLDVKSSSGYVALDRQALDMFRRAGPRVALPDALRGKAFTLDVRAIYSLKDQASG